MPGCTLASQPGEKQSPDWAEPGDAGPGLRYRQASGANGGRRRGPAHNGMTHSGMTHSGMTHA